MGGRGIQVGRVAGVPVLLAPSWFVFAGFIVLSYGPVLAPQVGARSAYVAAGSFAVLLGLSVLLHEVGHCLVARRFGLPVRSITVTLLAGLTDIAEAPQTPARECAVAAAGPLVSVALAAGGFASLPLAPPGGLLRLVLEGVAVTNAVVAVFNLLPGLPLDGGRVLRAAVWRATGDHRRATVASAWSGRGLGVVVVPLVLLVALPALGVGGAGLGSAVFAALVSAYIYTGATAALRLAQASGRAAAVTAGSLARPAVTVAAGTPLAEAVRRAQEAGAGGVVVVDGAGEPASVLSEAAVLATPMDRRPWVDAETAGRRVVPGLVLPAALGGDDLLDALRRTPATEYLVADASGVRVLAAADVARALGAAR